MKKAFPYFILVSCILVSFASNAKICAPVGSALSSITGVDSVCTGATSTLSDATAGGSWSSSNTDRAVVGSGTGIVTGVAAGTTIISYTFSDVSVTVVVTVEPLPDAGSIFGPSTVCAGSTINLTDPVLGGSWSHSNFNAVVSSFSGVVTGLAAGADTIIYSVTDICTASVSWVIEVEIPAATISTTSSSFHVCIGGMITLSDAVTGGTWSASNTNAGVSGSGIVSGIAPGADTIYYNVLNACGSTQESTVVTVDHWPAVYSVTGGGRYCEGGTGVSIGLSGSDIGISYLLYYGSSVTGYLPGTGSALNFGLLTVPGVYTVLATTLAGCPNNMQDSAVIIVIPTVNPTVSIVAGTGDSVCAGTTVTFIPVADSGGATPAFAWSVNGVLVSLDSTYTFIPADTDVISVTLTSDAHCVSPLTASASLKIYVLPWGNPTASITVDPGDTVCEFSKAVFTATSMFGGPSPDYTWYVNSEDVGSGPLYSYYPATGDTVYCKITSDYRCLSSPAGNSNAVLMTVAPMIVPHVEIMSIPGTAIIVNEYDTLIAVVKDGGINPSYQWEVNGIPVLGATSSAFVSQFNNYDSVTCIVTSSGVCNDVSSFAWVFISVNPLGAQQYALGNDDIKLIPNPTKGIFSVSGALGAITNRDVTLEIADMLGQVVYRDKVSVTGGRINEFVSLSSTLPNGMYLLNLRSGSDNKVFHFVIER